jgi:competence protein ComEC
MPRGYGGRAPWRRHQLTDLGVVAVAGAVVIGAWAGSALVAVASAAAVALVLRSPVVLVAGLLLGVGAAALGQRAWAEAQPRALGAYTGWVQVVGDTTTSGAGTRITLEVEGERFDAWLYGRMRRTLGAREAGEWVWVDGTRRPLGAHPRRAQARHVVGRFDVDVVGDWTPGAPVSRAANRVRDALRRAAATAMPPAEAALFTGLVIGDDTRQPAEMVADFRRSGLSHLTAVSGQNVAFVLAAAAPLLRRLRPVGRWAASLLLIGWFMALTRFEPSILRAGVMAMLAATAFVLGHRESPVRLLAWAVVVLVLVDPLLVWSVGFWLSVGATAGVCVVAPRLAARLPGPVWVRLPLAVTVGAQAGVALPALLVFGRLPLVSLGANLLAVPAAGFVMLYGLPAGVVAAALPGPLAALVMAPAAIATRWVAIVAALAARVEPSGAWAWAGWCLVASALVAVCRRPARVPM